MHRTAPPDSDPERNAAREAEAQRAEAAIRVQYAELEARLRTGEFLCGAFSVADIATFMTVLFALRLTGPPLDGHPALDAWYARVGARPSAARAAAEIAAADRDLSRPLG